MTAPCPGPPIRSFSAARRWYLFEVRDLLTSPFQDLSEGRRLYALFTLLLWPIGLAGLCIDLIQVTLAVMRRGDKDEMLDRMWSKVAEGMTQDLFRYQPDGSEIEVPSEREEPGLGGAEPA